MSVKVPPTIDNDDHATLKRLNTWLIVIGAFMILYTAGLFMFIEHKADEIQNDKTVVAVAVDPVTGNIQSNYQNLFPTALLPKISALNPPSDQSTNNTTMYVEKKTYEVQEFVIIKYYHQSGVVLEKLSNDKYIILCRDHNRRLFTIEMPRNMLIVPSLHRNMNPFALVND